MKIIDKDFLNEVSEQAKTSPRLRMNYNFHQSLEDKCHRFLNAVEPGTKDARGHSRPRVSRVSPSPCFPGVLMKC